MARGRGLLAENVYRRMRADLPRGRIRPGTACPRCGPPPAYRASRTPVREACRRLAEEGLLVHRPRHGYAAPVIDAREISELYDVRRSLEVLSVRGAASAEGPRPEIERLRRAWDAAAPEPGEGAVFLDEAFHVGLARTSGNRVLTTMLEGVNARIRLVRVYDVLDADRVDRTVAQHTAILDAVVARDADRAAALMDAHIAESQEVATAAAGQVLAELWTGAATA